jgi:hypothetical protein
MSFQNNPSACGNNYKPNADASNAGTMAQMLMNKLAAATQGCDTKSMAASLSYKASAGLGGMLGGAEGRASLNMASVDGCQALQSVVANYLNSIYTSRCIINNNTNTAGVIVTNTTNINSVASGAGSVLSFPPDCPGGPNITVSSITTLKNFSSLSIETQTQIANTVKSGMTQTLAQLQNITSAAGGTPQGSANLSTVQQKFQNEDMLTQLNNSSSSVQNQITQLTNLNFAAYNGGKNTTFPCVINTSSILDLQLAEIISEAYSTSVKGEIAATMAGAISSTSTIKNLAPPSALDSGPWSAIAGIVGAIVLAIIVVMIVKSGALKGAVDAAANAAANAKGGGVGGKAGMLESMGGKAGMLESMAFRRRGRFY